MSKSEMVTGKQFGPYKGVKTVDLTGLVDADVEARSSDSDMTEFLLSVFKATSIDVKQNGSVLTIRRTNTSKRRSPAKRTIIGDKFFECIDNFPEGD